MSTWVVRRPIIRPLLVFPLLLSLFAHSLLNRIFGFCLLLLDDIESLRESVIAGVERVRGPQLSQFNNSSLFLHITDRGKKLETINKWTMQNIKQRTFIRFNSSDSHTNYFRSQGQTVEIVWRTRKGDDSHWHQQAEVYYGHQDRRRDLNRLNLTATGVHLLPWAHS